MILILKSRFDFVNISARYHMQQVYYYLSILNTQIEYLTYIKLRSIFAYN